MGLVVRGSQYLTFCIFSPVTSMEPLRCPCHLHQDAGPSLPPFFACLYHTGCGWLLQPKVHLHCTIIALGLPP